MKEQVRVGTFHADSEKQASAPTPTALTFDAFADLFVERYVKAKGLRSLDKIQWQMPFIKVRLGPKALADIRVGDIDDLVQDLKARKRKPATINRYLALLRRMLNWAVEREYLDRTPFRRGSQAVIKLERENNRRSRRLAADEEKRLLNAAPPTTKALIIAALDTGMRRGELLSLRFGDVDFDRRVIHVRPENAKSKKGRSIPIATTRLMAVLDWLRIDAAGAPKPNAAPVFSNRVSEPLRDFRDGWLGALAAANIAGLWFHDLRGEYASRLVERGVPLSQVRDLLGHASIVTTERYDRQRFEALEAAAKRLDDGQTFNFLSTSPDDAIDTPRAIDTPSVSNSLRVN
jgi:integrase